MIFDQGPLANKCVQCHSGWGKGKMGSKSSYDKKAGPGQLSSRGLSDLRSKNPRPKAKRCYVVPVKG